MNFRLLYMCVHDNSIWGDKRLHPDSFYVKTKLWNNPVRRPTEDLAVCSKWVFSLATGYLTAGLLLFVWFWGVSVKVIYTNYYVMSHLRSNARGLSSGLKLKPTLGGCNWSNLLTQFSQLNNLSDRCTDLLQAAGWVAAKMATSSSCHNQPHHSKKIM